MKMLFCLVTVSEIQRMFKEIIETNREQHSVSMGWIDSSKFPYRSSFAVSTDIC